MKAHLMVVSTLVLCFAVALLLPPRVASGDWQVFPPIIYAFPDSTGNSSTSGWENEETYRTEYYYDDTTGTSDGDSDDGDTGSAWLYAESHGDASCNFYLQTYGTGSYSASLNSYGGFVASAQWQWNGPPGQSPPMTISLSDYASGTVTCAGSAIGAGWMGVVSENVYSTGCGWSFSGSRGADARANGWVSGTASMGMVGTTSSGYEGTGWLTPGDALLLEGRYGLAADFEFEIQAQYVTSAGRSTLGANAQAYSQAVATGSITVLNAPLGYGGWIGASASAETDACSYTEISW